MIDVAKILQVNTADITSKYRSLWLNTFGIKEGEQADEFKEKLNLILSEEEHAILWSAINMRMLVSIVPADQIHALVKPTGPVKKTQLSKLATFCFRSADFKIK